MIGRTISRYHVVELLGAGGMGVVYKARDTRLGRTVALKFISEAFAADPIALRQFEREAQTASSLNHPTSAPSTRSTSSTGFRSLRWNSCRGGTLTQRMRGAPLETLDIIDFTIQIADALDAAHEKGDRASRRKPANIFISDRDVVKLLDFGLAKQASVVDFDANASSGFTAAGRRLRHRQLHVSGAPPRARARSPSDLFSLGAVVNQMATASKAFRATSAIETIDAILHDQPRRDPTDSAGAETAHQEAAREEPG